MKVYAITFASIVGLVTGRLQGSIDQSPASQKQWQIPSATPNKREPLMVFEDCMDPASIQENVDFFTQSSPDYIEYSNGAMGRNMRTPAGIFFAETEDDIARAVVCARKANLQPVPRSGGHSYEALSSLDGSLVIDLGSMNKVQVVKVESDGKFGVATVQAGAKLGHVYMELAAQGDFSFNAGFCPGVGMGGHIGGGGYGMESRKYGMAADQTISMRIVTATGKILEVSESKNSDLFWALRGGSMGSFGIITEFTIRVHREPVGTMFKFLFAPEALANVVRGWMNYFTDADNRVTTTVSIEQHQISLVGEFLGPKSELDVMLSKAGVATWGNLLLPAYVEECSTIGRKAFAWAGIIIPGATCSNVEVLQTDTHPRYTTAYRYYNKAKSAYASKKLPEEGIKLLADAVPKGPSDLLIMLEGYQGVLKGQPLSMSPWGGRDSVFSAMFVHYVDEGETLDSPGYQWLYNLTSAFDKYGNGKRYGNYVDLDIGSNWGDVYFGAENFDRLISIKQKYDPMNIFYNPQSIPLKRDVKK